MLITNPGSRHERPSPSLNWSELVQPGWIPAEIAGREPLIRWMRIGSSILSDPFFGSSVLRFRAGLTPEVESSLAVLERGTDHLPGVTPAGIVVHITRCGSTLLVNALKAAENVVGLGEAGSVDSLLGLAACQSNHRQSAARMLLTPLTTVFAHYRGGPADKVVVKCGLWGLMWLRTMRSVWPNVPCIILVRDPIEVLVSNWRSPPAWTWDARLISGARPIGEPPAEVAALGAIDLCAWTIGQLCTAAVETADANCRVVDYKNLTPDVVAEIANGFGLNFSEEGRLRFQDVFRRDAKRPAREFRPDEQEKQDAATDAMRKAAARWIAAPYEDLRARQRIASANEL